MRKKRIAQKSVKRRFLRSLLKLILAIFIILTVAFTVIGLALAVYIDKKIDKTVDESLFTVIGGDGVTKLYYYEFTDRENRVGECVELSDEELYGGYSSVYAKLEDIPKDMVNAFISIEDKRFYSHSGVDWKRTFSAGVNYFLHFRSSYGGSTITQQLIKNVTQNDEYSFNRKLQEIFWALDLETKLSKNEIIEKYLNVINLSQGCYGVGAAANYYFSKDIEELTLNECAAIAAITNSPSYYDPILNPENNLYRKDLILKAMYEQEYISEQEYNECAGAPVTLNVEQKRENSNVNSWYTDMVIEDVIEGLMNEKGISRQVANLMVYTGGLRIYTAMDREAQKTVEEYYAKTNNFYSSTSGETPQSSMIVIDPKTGDILAVAGGVGEKKADRIQNFATQTLRPAGSVIKPLSVYAPALDRGILNWASVYDDVPVSFGNYNLDPGRGEIVEPKPWPSNSSGTYRGLTNVNYAIEHSLNTVVVKALTELGLRESFDFLYDELEIKSIIASKILEDGRTVTDIDLAALALGQFNYGVTVRECTAAYSIFANDGVYNKPRSYYKVEDSQGNLVLENKYEGKAVISEESAQIMTKMLENVVKNGTATAITLDSEIACAGKTGTTQNNCDRWYIGYTPYYICGVWYGYEYPKPIYDGMGNRCIRIWDDVMKKLHSEIIYSSSGQNENIKSFELSDNITEVEYCMDSGLLLSEACKRDARGSRVEKGYFVRGTEPDKYCNVHVSVRYDTVSGGIANDACPEEDVIYVGMINVQRSFPMQVTVTDAEYVWRDISGKVTPNSSPDLPFFVNLLAQGEYCGISRSKRQYNSYCREHFK